MASGGDVVLAEIPKETRKLTWRVADFARIGKCKKLLNAVNLEIKMGHKLTFPVTLRAQLEWLEKDEESWIGILLHLKSPTHDDPAIPVIISAKIKFGNMKLLSLDPRDMNQSEWVERTWGYPKLLRTTASLDTLGLAADGSLTIELEVTLYDAREMQLTRSNPPPLSVLLQQFESRFTSQLKQDLEDMFRNPGVSADPPPMWIKMRSRDGKEFIANSSILAARSPVFRTMFQTPMSEVKKGVVNMKDIEGMALEVFLHFMHTGVLRDEWKEPKILEELTEAAHKYLVQDLLEFLDEALGLVCHSDDCADMIRLAQRLEMKKAEEALLNMRKGQWNKAKEMEEMSALFNE